MPALVEVADSSVIAEALSVRAPDLLGFARQVAGDSELVLAAMDALGSATPRVRFAASRLLRIVSENSPAGLYPHFDFFVRLLRDKNSILRWNAMLTLGHLAAADHQKKLDAILDSYLVPISGKNLMDATNTIRGAASIARAKPYLADRIAKTILAVEKARYATPECRNVAIGHAIHALDEFFPLLQDQRAVLSFVKRQGKNARRSTRNKARKFLAKCQATPGQTAPCELSDSY
ncbi:MAG: hypothetical protein DMG40_14095 [Acidobacteria bacterium]|nr:MAG: hypothetical protein DMG40_14095 [Acidobacteriota bacterium]